MSVTTSISLTISLGSTKFTLGNTTINSRIGPKPQPQLKPKPSTAPSTVVIEEISDDEKGHKSKPKEIEDTSKALVLANHTPAAKKQERREVVKTAKIINNNKAATGSVAHIKQFKPFVMPANSNHHANLKSKQSKLPTAKETGIKTDMSKALVACKPKSPPLSNNNHPDYHNKLIKIEIKGAPYTVDGVCAAMGRKGHMISKYWLKDTLIPELQARGMPRDYDNEAAAQAATSFMQFADPIWK